MAKKTKYSLWKISILAIIVLVILVLIIVHINNESGLGATLAAQINPEACALLTGGQTKKPVAGTYKPDSSYHPNASKNPAFQTLIVTTDEDGTYNIKYQEKPKSFSGQFEEMGGEFTSTDGLIHFSATEKEDTIVTWLKVGKKACTVYKKVDGP